MPVTPCRTAALAALTAGVLLLGTACSAEQSAPSADTGARVAAARQPVTSSGSTAVDAALATAERRPRDPQAWTTLAMTALEAGRAGGEPALYAQARQAADRSLTVQPDGNAGALAARAMLSAAEHDFPAARDHATRALAADPESPEALAALVDAETGLGRLDQALTAAQRLDALRPGVASFTRLSYQAELRGDLPRARELMDRAASLSVSPGEIAFARAQGGLLALTAGDVEGATTQWKRGVAQAPQDVTLAHLEARIAVARGDLAVAARLYASLVERRPSAQFTSEQADVLAATGDRRGAQTALTLARAAYEVESRSGVLPEGGQVLFEADHGDAAAAVALGREVFRRSPTADHADALAWALHRAGMDEEALTLSQQALASGARAPGYREHHAAIVEALRTGS